MCWPSPVRSRWNRAIIVAYTAVSPVTLSAMMEPTKLVSPVSMPWAEGLQDVAVVLAPLVGVFDEQADGGAGGSAFVHARQNFDRIRLVALGDEFGGAGTAAIQIRLDVGFAQRHARWAAINYAANGRAVGFTEIGDCE